jgi:imidazolonepropionase-like amidohydrolase
MFSQKDVTMSNLTAPRFVSLRRLSLGLLLAAAAFGWGGAREKTPPILVLTGARLIDGRGGAPLDGATIVITGDRFTAVGPAARTAVPPDATVLDVKGKTVIPGLIDAHIHLTWAARPEDFLVLNQALAAFRAADLLARCLSAGITTVRDCASYENVGLMARQAFNAGALAGSRPVVCGQGITSTGGHGTEGYARGLVMEVDGPAGFRAGVRTQLAAGADFVKILCPFSRDEIFAAVEEAHLHEKFVTVHPSLFRAQFDFLRWTVEAGADCFEHAYAVPDDVIPKIAEKKMSCVPTLAILKILGEQYKKRGPEWDWKVRKYFECEEIFRKLRKAGVKMAVGTDATYENMAEYPGLFFKEAEEFVALGASPMETIVAATKIGAEVSDAAALLGTIEAGKLADLLVLQKDPLADIRNLRTAEVIVQGGRIVKR